MSGRRNFPHPHSKLGHKKGQRKTRHVHRNIAASIHDRFLSVDLQRLEDEDWTPSPTEGTEDPEEVGIDGRFVSVDLQPLEDEVWGPAQNRESPEGSEVIPAPGQIPEGPASPPPEPEGFEEDMWQMSRRRTRSGANALPKSPSSPLEEKPLVRSKPKKVRKVRVRAREVPDSSDDEPKVEVNEALRQCLALECTKAARTRSKYCSKECCIQLATDRIRAILPGRVDEWMRTPCVAEEKNKQRVAEVKLHQQTSKEKIALLDRERASVEDYILQVQTMRVNPEVVLPEVLEDEGMIVCISCGVDIVTRNIMKHLDRCFAKFERKRCLESRFQTKIEGGPLLCDVYNKREKTFCKCLKVICPKHSKPPSIVEGQICGCPLVKGMEVESSLLEMSREKCPYPKSECNRHHGWEKARLVSIDIQRLNLWRKLEALFTEERQELMAMHSRRGLLNILLHQTTVHDTPQTSEERLQ